MADEPLPLLPHEQPLAPRTDLWVAASFVVFSVAILALTWRMPTYTDQGGQIYTAPALVPSFYAVVILLLSVWLMLRAIRSGALTPAGTQGPPQEEGNSTARFVLAAGLGAVFIVGLIGRMPFWLAAAIFVALFIAGFEWRPGLDRKARLRVVAIAVVQGVLTGVLVTLVFERVFLVRLP
jgi:hypothetical protein